MGFHVEVLVYRTHRSLAKVVQGALLRGKGLRCSWRQKGLQDLSVKAWVFGLGGDGEASR